MDQVFCVYKPVGKTPLQMVQLLKNRYHVLRDETISYAGRLDPMADGILLLLQGEANKKRHFFESLPKVYTCKCILGITTDTYDLLGLVKKRMLPKTAHMKRFQEILPQFIGTQNQAYPPYSSKTVNGEPLYRLARENRLPHVLPTKKITITEVTVTGKKNLSANDLLSYIQKSLPHEGDFRQKEIVDSWTSSLHGVSEPLQAYMLSLSCSSGTYVRALVHHLGENLGCGAVTMRITRTKIGEYSLVNALRL